MEIMALGGVNGDTEKDLLARGLLVLLNGRGQPEVAENTQNDGHVTVAGDLGDVHQADVVDVHSALLAVGQQYGRQLH